MNLKPISRANDDPILRWNNCARLCQRHGLKPEPEAPCEPVLGTLEE